MRILLIKTSSLGDVIHNLPVVNDLLTHYPKASIDWVVEESFAEVPSLHPNVHQVIRLAIRRWRKHVFKRSTWHEIRLFLQQVRSRHYDVIIDTQGLIKSGCIALMAQGLKHGYDKQSIREPLASACYQQTHRIAYQQHAVTRNRTLVALSLGYAIPNSAPDYGIAPPALNEALASIMVDAHGQIRPYAIGLHGTSRDSKLWPEAEWIALGKLLEDIGLTLYLPWSSQAEFVRATSIATQLPHAKVLPKLSIRELATVIGQAQVAIGVDTGLSHLAAALNTPIVAIYTDTNPALTGVMQGAVTPAINLGGVAQVPKHIEVFNHLKQIIATQQ